jgi:nitrogenase iron protein NifH
MAAGPTEEIQLMSRRKIKQIGIYGKGGIGKSTTTCNISAALADAGYKVMQFGCDPKADSTNTLRGGEYIPSVLDLLSERRRVDAHEAIFRGVNGIYCVEAGGPSPGIGCAGRGIITAVELLKQQNIFEELGLDIVLGPKRMFTVRPIPSRTRRISPRSPRQKGF